jgi:hypothetical protein
MHYIPTNWKEEAVYRLNYERIPEKIVTPFMLIT